MAVSTGATANATVQLSDAQRTVYSAEIRYASQPLLRFDQFVDVKEELGRIPGSGIQFMKYNDMTGGISALTEGTDMTKNSLGTSTVTISLSEYGNALQISEQLRTQSFDDLMASMSRLLGYNAARSLDSNHRNTLEGTSNVNFPGGKTARTALAANDYFDTAIIKDTVVDLATNKAPKINGDTYVCFVHPAQARRIRDDGSWTNASNYGAPDQLFLGEIGRFEDVTFVETTMIRYIDTSGNLIEDGTDEGNNASSTPLVNTYQALMLGDHAWGKAVAKDVSLRDDGVEDFGRKHSLAWYAILGFGRIEGNHVFRIETAA